MADRSSPDPIALFDIKNIPKTTLSQEADFQYNDKEMVEAEISTKISGENIGQGLASSKFALEDQTDHLEKQANNMGMVVYSSPIIQSNILNEEDFEQMEITTEKISDNQNRNENDGDENTARTQKRPASTTFEENQNQRPMFEFIPGKSTSAKKSFSGSQKPQTVSECMELAFNMVLRAMYLSEDLKEKQNLHDISVVHREYQEYGKISWARSILGQEIRALERVSRQLGNHVQNNHSKPTPPQKQVINQPAPMATGHQDEKTITETPTKTSYANVTSSNIQKSADNPNTQSWTKVTHQKKPESSAGQAQKKCRQLVLITTENSSSNVNSMHLRNAINNAFIKAGAQKPVILTANRSLMKKNIVLTTTESFSAEYLLEKKKIWEHLIPHTSCQVNTPWHKVVIHGVPIADFDNENFDIMVKEEIQTFNHGLKIIGNPYWLTSAERRSRQFSGSIVVAFATEKESNTAIRNRLYMAGKSLKVEKQYSVAPTNQCEKCQGFGHLESKCTRPERCQICAGNHHTKQHKCSSCSAKGKSCVHSLLKCVNCGQSHKANDLSCEVYRVLKDGPSQNSETQPQDNETESL